MAAGDDYFAELLLGEFCSVFAGAAHRVEVEGGGDVEVSVPEDSEETKGAFVDIGAVVDSFAAEPCFVADRIIGGAEFFLLRFQLIPKFLLLDRLFLRLKAHFLLWDLNSDVDLLASSPRRPINFCLWLYYGRLALFFNLLPLFAFSCSQTPSHIF